VDLGGIFADGDEPIAVTRDVYLYITTPDGDVWELPVPTGTKLRFRHHRSPEQWPGFHGCGFKTEWD
jgi:hypothetical protein